MLFKRIAVASDHADLAFKTSFVSYAREKSIEVLDLGPAEDFTGSVDYPDYAEKLATHVLENKVDGAVAICGTGIGMSIAANKFPGIRAACPWNAFTAEMVKRHNNINILCLGARTLSKEEAFSIFDLWLSTPFEGGRHQKRLDKIAALDRKNL